MLGPVLQGVTRLVQVSVLVVYSCYPAKGPFDVVQHLFDDVGRHLVSCHARSQRAPQVVDRPAFDPATEV